MRGLILRKLAREEHRLGESLDYVRHILRVSLGAFFRFAKIFSISSYRKTLPPDAQHVAALVASRDEDCGTCVQIGVNLAKQDGVSIETLRAVIDARPEDLEAGLADVYRFTEGVVRAKEAVDASPDETEVLRTRLRERYGEQAVVELALTIAASRFYPIVKRSLGYATSCSLVKIRL